MDIQKRLTIKTAKEIKKAMTGILIMAFKLCRYPMRKENLLGRWLENVRTCLIAA